MKRIPEGTYVHTFRQGGGVLIGADWTRDRLLKAIRMFGVEEAGETATAMGHGLIIVDEVGALFVETKKELLAGTDVS